MIRHNTLIRKEPRDFIWLDEFREAGPDWPEVYPGHQVWLNVHEYNAELAGDVSHLRLTISGGAGVNLVWETNPDAAHVLQRKLSGLQQPLSYSALKHQGFEFREDPDD